jgi:hypothetical protein
MRPILRDAAQERGSSSDNGEAVAQGYAVNVVRPGQDLT